MRGRTKLALAVAGLAVVALAVTSFAVAGGGKGKDNGRRGTETFAARLGGYNEVPSLNTTGKGSLTLTIDTNAKTISFKLDYEGLSGNPTAAHVHVGQIGVSGGVSFFFCGGGGKPACPASTSGSVSGTVAPADILGPTAQGFNAGDFGAVVAAIEHGVAYGNMHTAKFPAGEIRGQLFHAGHGHH